MTKHVVTVGYHLVGSTLRDGRPVPPDGEWLEHDGPLVMCEAGLHASLHPFDALRYAPGPVLCLVELGERIVSDTDKVISNRRRIVRRFDATDLLGAFARQCALDGRCLGRCLGAAARDAQRQRFAALVDAAFGEIAR